MTLPGLVRANNLSDIVDRERAWDNLGSSVSADIPISRPSLDLNFAANKSLVDDISGNNLITFSRASTGTFVGSNGLIQTAASGVPRFDHNPTTGESLGLLVEEARTNLALYSEQLDNVAWTKDSCSITANATTAPDGTATADKLVEGTSAYNLVALTSGSTATSTAYTATAYVKAAERSACYIRLAYTGNSNWISAKYDLINGVAQVVIGPLSTSYTNASASIQACSNGWWRISCTCTGSNMSPRWGAIDSYSTAIQGSSGVPFYTGNGTSGFFIWGAQLEAGSFPTSYIPTTTATVTRAADVASITGGDFSSWYNATEGTLFAAQRSDTIQDAYETSTFNLSSSNRNAHFIGMDVTNDYNRTDVYGNGPVASIEPYAPVTPGTLSKNALAYQLNNVAAVRNGGTVFTDTSVGLPIVEIDRATIGHTLIYGQQKRQHLSRLTYYPARLSNLTLQYLTSASGSPSSTTYPYTFTIKGKDTLALNAVRNASTRDFIFIKGLLSAAQPRLTAAAATTSSGLTLVANALPKLAPSSNGNYFFASGLTLSGVTTRINGTNALSIATSPFSGSTATAPLLFRELRPQTNWRITEPMTSGTIASPEFAIPFETNDFVLFMKAGQN